MVYVALLRAINVGARRLAMVDLRALAGELGLTNPTTLLQSGNLVFGSPSKSSAALERRCEVAAEERFGFRTEFFVRTAPEWAQIVAGNPFPREAERDAGHLIVLLLKSAPSTAQGSALDGAIRGREYVRIAGTHAYAVYPDGVGESKFTVALIEAKLGCRASGRNWNTALKLLALTH
jgi:uncharacterized protein (DUF1697 family)